MKKKCKFANRLNELSRLAKESELEEALADHGTTLDGHRNDLEARLAELANDHSTNHGYIMNDALQFTIQFERITEGASVSGRSGRASASTPPPDVLANRLV